MTTGVPDPAARDMGVAIDGWIEVDKRAEVGRGRRKSDKTG